MTNDELYKSVRDSLGKMKTLIECAECDWVCGHSPYVSRGSLCIRELDKSVVSILEEIKNTADAILQDMQDGSNSSKEDRGNV